MSKQIQIRRGSATEHENFTGAIGEITMDTTNKTLRVHDGENTGGIMLAKQSELSSFTDKNLSDISTQAKDLISNLSTPDDSRTISLSIGKSGTVYTAPANGYITFRFSLLDTGFVQIDFAGTNIGYMVNNPWGIIPISKNQKFIIHYQSKQTANYEFLKFTYSKGAI